MGKKWERPKTFLREGGGTGSGVLGGQKEIAKNGVSAKRSKDEGNQGEVS